MLWLIDRVRARPRFVVLQALALAALSGCGSEAPPIPTSIVISPTNSSVEVGQTRSFSAQIRDDRGGVYPGTVSWNSSNVTRAVVDPAGMAEGIAPGDVFVQALFEGLVGSASLKVTDSAPPSVSLLNPIGGSTVSGTVTVRAAASDNHRVAYVALVVDGAGVDTLRSSPWEFSWATTSATNGSHSVRVVAADPSGNESTSDAVMVNVSNVTKVRIRNQLLTRIFTNVNGLTGWVAGGSFYDFSVVVAAGGVINVSWEAERPKTTTGTQLGEEFGGVFGSRTPDESVEEFFVDNELTSGVFYFASVSNNTGVTLWPAVNVTVSSEYRCPCSLPPGFQRGSIGFYRLHQFSTVGVYNSEKGYGGPVSYFEVTSANIDSPTGLAEFGFSAAPALTDSQGVRRVPRTIDPDQVDRPLDRPLLDWSRVTPGSSLLLPSNTGQLPM